MERGKPPSPVDQVPPEMKKDVRAGKSGRDESAPSTGRRITEEEKRHAKIMSAEKKRMRRDEPRNERTGRSKDGTWAKKNSATHFGNRLHTGNRYSNDQGICCHHSITP